MCIRDSTYRHEEEVQGDFQGQDPSGPVLQQPLADQETKQAQAEVPEVAGSAFHKHPQSQATSWWIGGSCDVQSKTWHQQAEEAKQGTGRSEGLQRSEEVFSQTGQRAAAEVQDLRLQGSQGSQERVPEAMDHADQCGRPST